MLNHKEVVHYGWTFFKIACKQAKEFEKKQLVNGSSSVRLAFANKREYQKFLKGF